MKTIGPYKVQTTNVVITVPTEVREALGLRRNREYERGIENNENYFN